MKLCPKTERPGPVPEPDACFPGRAIKSQKEPDESNEEETVMNKHIDRLGRIVIPHDIRDKMKVTPLDTFHAVSYTHLDVYKRQGQGGGR